MSNIQTVSDQLPAIYAMDESHAISVLQESLYPGAKPQSIMLVMDYCRAANLDPMQKPVHIVPMWDKNTKGMRDVIMPGVNSYRVNAMRSKDYAGISEPEFGPMVDGSSLGIVNFQYPEWCKVTVKRVLRGVVAEFTAVEYWIENYATAGKDSIAPNAMWKKRPRGQIAKCAEAQALRKAFPEIASAPTFEEMDGKFESAQAGDVRAVPVEPAQPALDPSKDIEAVQQTTTDADALAYWNKHQGKYRSDAAAHAQFKTAVIDHRTNLKAANITDVEVKE
jgi:phage recombination protein Bet